MFLSKDLIGQSFLCFLIHKTLVLVKIGNDLDLTFGVAQKILDVEDASPFNQLGMILILDRFHKLNLYSGAQKVCGVHFNYSPSVQLAHIAQEIATLHIGKQTIHSDKYSDVNLETTFFEFLFCIIMSPYWALYYCKILSES